MKIFNIELTLSKKDIGYGTIENYPGYLRKKMMQLLIITVIYFILFYTLSFFSKQFDKLSTAAPSSTEQEFIKE